MQLTKALESLQGYFNLSILGMEMNNSKPIEVRIDHKFREEMIVPYCAIDNNVAFLLYKGERYLDTKDGVRCKVLSAEERHICDMEADVQRLYGKDAWSFIKIWHKYNNMASSLFFVHLKLQKADPA